MSTTLQETPAPSDHGKNNYREILDLHLDHYAGHRLPFVCTQASGVRQIFRPIEDTGTPEEDIEVIDASGGYASACLGAGHPAMVEGLQKSLSKVGYVTDEVTSIERLEFLREYFGPEGAWTNHFPYGEYHVSGRNSGSEGMELALRIVFESLYDSKRLRKRPGKEARRRLLVFEGAWHGWTSGTLSLLNRRHFTKGLPLIGAEATEDLVIDFIPFGYPEILRDYFSAHGSELAAVIVEPIQGDAGIFPAPDGYLRDLVHQAKACGALVVADEILTFAKSGHFFAMRDEEGPIQTDVTVIGKNIGMGVVSTSLVIARQSLNLRSCVAVATSDMRPFTCAIMRTGLDYIRKEGLLERSAQIGEELRANLRKHLLEPYPKLFKEVRGLGYINGIETSEHLAPHIGTLRKCMIESGVYVEVMAGAGRRSRQLPYIFPTLRFAPPLIADRDDCEAIVQRAAEGVARFHQNFLADS